MLERSDFITLQQKLHLTIWLTDSALSNVALFLSPVQFLVKFFSIGPLLLLPSCTLQLVQHSAFCLLKQVIFKNLDATHIRSIHSENLEMTIRNTLCRHWQKKIKKLPGSTYPSREPILG